MMHTATTEANHPFNPNRNDHRHQKTGDFMLVEVDRANMVDSIRQDGGYQPDGVFALGEMRELCPCCKVHHLKLVLRQKRVRHAHLYCDYCDKSFDARHPDGRSALELDE
ncbi:MAG: hypothetical protein P4L91_10420 [Burkholderiaceae bacterium]|nr:hypothetical protein [Burkholderiaceae bacterium]